MFIKDFEDFNELLIKGFDKVFNKIVDLAKKIFL